jgi:hypothetical protein
MNSPERSKSVCRRSNIQYEFCSQKFEIFFCIPSRVRLSRIGSKERIWAESRC